VASHHNSQAARGMLRHGMLQCCDFLYPNGVYAVPCHMRAPLCNVHSRLVAHPSAVCLAHDGRFLPHARSAHCGSTSRAAVACAACPFVLAHAPTLLDCFCVYSKGSWLKHAWPLYMVCAAGFLLGLSAPCLHPRRLAPLQWAIVCDGEGQGAEGRKCG
jgi:hypothetical protein